MCVCVCLCLVFDETMYQAVPLFVVAWTSAYLVGSLVYSAALEKQVPASDMSTPANVKK